MMCEEIRKKERILLAVGAVIILAVILYILQPVLRSL